jgi:ferredoxin
MSETKQKQMTAKTGRKQLIDWLDHIMDEQVVIAPRDVAGVLCYQPVESSKDIVFDYIRPLMSAKEFFFPPSEQLMTIERQGNRVALIENQFKDRQVIFGVRPCDARGILAIDALFLDTEPVDPYYRQRRYNSIIIGIACKEEGPTCFCTKLGASLLDSNGMDIQLLQNEDDYILRTITEKGRQFIAETNLALFDRTLLTEIENIELEVNPLQIPREKWQTHFADRFWEEYSERCLSCRICAYVCPTCRCFDLRDEVIPSNDGNQKYERIRCWDSCAREGYRRAAGGHVQRPEKGDRLRNRFYCKYYYFPIQYSLDACTGCGRCIDLCPVGIDITEVLDYMTKVAT